VVVKATVVISIVWMKTNDVMMLILMEMIMSMMEVMRWIVMMKFVV
jgi:hypothetical protein